MGRAVSATQRKCGQGHVAPLAPRRPVAQNRAGALRVGATRNKHNYLHAQFVRLRARRGPQKAIIAVAASILSIAYYLLRNQMPYRDLGALYFTRADQERTAQRLARRIKDLGYEVQIRKAA